MTEDRLDTRKVQFPRKDGVSSQSGLQTPNRPVQEPQEPSRPETPPSTPQGELVNGNAVLAAALNKKLTRKRKMPSIEAEVRI